MVLAVPIGAMAGGLVVGLVARMAGPRSVNGPARIALVAVTAAAFAAVAAVFEVSWAMVVPLILFPALVALSAIDLYRYRLPDPVIFTTFGVSLVAMAAVAPTVGGFGTIVLALAGSAGYGAVLWVVYEISPEGLGFGDVKLGFVCGLHLGWVSGAFHPSWVSVVGLVSGALLMAGILGVIGGLVVAVLRRRGYRVLPYPEADSGPVGQPTVDGSGDRPGRLIDNSFPFGPALAVGTMVAVLFWEPLVG